MKFGVHVYLHVDFILISATLGIPEPRQADKRILFHVFLCPYPNPNSPWNRQNFQTLITMFKTPNFKRTILAAIFSVVSFSVWAGPKTFTFSVSLQSAPEEAKVYYNGKLISTTTPATVTLNLTKKEVANGVTLKFTKKGYPDGIVTVKPNLNKIGFFKIAEPISVCHEFAPGSAYMNDTSIQAGEAHTVVSRDNAGNSALERTIIRWFFDSAPQGAQVYWRVISSIPAEVKNTNENYMGTTPYEETRSFNILGLTYENSRDVQVEVKIKKRGYYDAVKRFNVRQAIDQQEISSFYDLVPKEE